MSSMKRLSPIVLLLVLVGLLFSSTNNVVTFFEVYPNPMEKNTTVYLNLTQSVYVIVTIETPEGRMLKKLQDSNLDVGSYQFNWNRITETGEYVSNGKYSVHLRYSSRYTSVKKTLILK